MGQDSYIDKELLALQAKKKKLANIKSSKNAKTGLKTHKNLEKVSKIDDKDALFAQMKKRKTSKISNLSGEPYFKSMAAPGPAHLEHIGEQLSTFLNGP